MLQHHYSDYLRGQPGGSRHEAKTHKSVWQQSRFIIYLSPQSKGMSGELESILASDALQHVFGHSLQNGTWIDPCWTWTVKPDQSMFKLDRYMFKLVQFIFCIEPLHLMVLCSGEVLFAPLVVQGYCWIWSFLDDFGTFCNKHAGAFGSDILGILFWWLCWWMGRHGW